MDETAQSAPSQLSSKIPVQASAGSIKETLEAILVAFIFAFIFRAFVVEAFVIPTGSMAPTLLGAHMRFRCPDCGYAFDVNYSTDSDADDVNIPSTAGPVMVGNHLEDKYYAIYCPNCGYKIDRTNDADAEDSSKNPPVYYGDRILVLKYLYLFQQPQRWDVVVFKNPNDFTHQYQTNYIKRLVGKPGETVLVLDGDVYISDKPSPAIEDFTIQTKPRHAQDALWRIVYDNDFYPLGRARADGSTWAQPWEPESGGQGWELGSNTSAKREFKFNNPTGAAAISFNRMSNPDKQSLTDWVAYDVTVNQGPHDLSDPTPASLSHGKPRQDNVSDLKLAFFYERKTGEGPLRAQMSKRDDLFTAEIFPDHVSLKHNRGNTVDEELGSAKIDLASGLHHVEFTNVDYRVTVRIDDRDLIQTTSQQYRPDIAKLLEEYQQNIKAPAPVVRILAERQEATLTHIGLWRDVYYTSYASMDRYRSGIFWASAHDFPNQLSQLGPDEYFVMGDNSLISGDARYWRDSDVDLPAENLISQSGRVPGRFLLGKAFFVYWPAGFRPVTAAPALVPDFGDMRFIH